MSVVEQNPLLLTQKRNSLAMSKKSKNLLEVKRRSVSEEISRNIDADRERSKSSSINNASHNSNNKSNRKFSVIESEGDNKALVPPGCECGPDLYSRILGPTADEAILFGLQAVLELCSKLRVCDDNEEETEPEPTEEEVAATPGAAEIEIEEDNLPEEPEPSPTASSQTSKPNADIKSQTSRHSISMTSQTAPQKSKTTPVQTQRNSISQPIQTSKLSINPVPAIVVTSPIEMVSQGLQISPSMDSKLIQTSLEPEMASQNIQTSFATPTPPSMYSKVLQTSSPGLKSEEMQTSRLGGSLISIPIQTSVLSFQSGAFQTSHKEFQTGGFQTSRQEVQSGKTQTSAYSLPAPSPLILSRDRSSITAKEEPTISLRKRSTATIPAVISEEPVSMVTPTAKVESAPASLLKKSVSARTQSEVITKLNRSTSDHVVAETKDSKSEGTENKETGDSTTQEGEQDEHACISPPEPPSSCQCCTCIASSTKGVLKKRPSKQEASNQHDGCICRGGKPRLKCKCASRSRRGSSESNVSSSTSRVGKGDSKRDPRPMEVRYSITKITKYEEFTTYEVMKSTKSVPRKMPKNIEGVFVLRKKKDR